MRRFTVLAALALLILFYFFSGAVRNGAMKDLDFAATVKIQEKVDKSSRLRTAAYIGNLFEGATFLASPGFSVLLVLVLTALASVDRKNRKIKLRGFLIPVLFGMLVLAEIYGKMVVEHPSPPFSFIKNPTTVFPAEYINEAYSYPSGHAARAVFLSLVFGSIFIFHARLIRTKLMILAGTLGYVSLVSVSRLYLGHHWFSDILGGWLLGAGIGILLYSHRPVIVRE